MCFLHSNRCSERTFHLCSFSWFLSLAIYYNYITIPCSHKLCKQKAILSYILEGPYYFSSYNSHSPVIASKNRDGYQQDSQCTQKGNKNTQLFNKSLVEDTQHTDENSIKSRTNESPNKTSPTCIIFRVQKSLSYLTEICMETS